jgi:REP element-mobilizing transposase RayT
MQKNPNFRGRIHLTGVWGFVLKTKTLKEDKNMSVYQRQNVGLNSRKRGLRVLPKSCGYFVHVTSRVVQQKFLFGNEEKEVFTDLLFRWADFSGISVLTYCLMNNHVHLLLWVPKVQQVRTEELFGRLERVWPERKVTAWMSAYLGAPRSIQKEMEGEVTRRMHSLPDFIRVLKQGFSAWYNKKHNLYGVFWDGRYRSMVLKNTPEALFSVAAYIDLNPMRAGICKDPGEYRWSGYGQAFRGQGVCREGLTLLVTITSGWSPRELGLRSKVLKYQSVTWKTTESLYRAWLYSKGRSTEEKTAAKSRRGFTSEEVLAEFAKTIEEINSR